MSSSALDKSKVFSDQASCGGQTPVYTPMFALAPEDGIWERSAWIPPAEQLLRRPYQPGLSNTPHLAHLNGRNIFACKSGTKRQEKAVESAHQLCCEIF